MSKRCMRKSERIEFRGNLWANTQYFLTKAASELWRIIHAHTHARVILLWSFVLLYSQKIGGDFTVRSFHSRDLACLDYPNISAPIGRNICLADAFLCLLLPNDIRVLFPKKSTFIKISLPLHLPNSPRVKDQGRTKDEPRNTQRTPNHQKVLD